MNVRYSCCTRASPGLGLLILHFFANIPSNTKLFLRLEKGICQAQRFQCRYRTRQRWLLCRFLAGDTRLPHAGTLPRRIDGTHPGSHRVMPGSENLSLNQLVAIALLTQVSAWMTKDDLEARATKEVEKNSKTFWQR